ncbi:hypothetical protein EZV62_004477 [Acer yangbiense]|uniref:O-fucosyltransferase family protein n=1 Tax=Acer yangbiense TaxID=1000413 RepID=A0A5C7ILP3_9ROSI|nr:hypothetical protein EZV62_004477 [Acer yangbiense]
MLRILRKIVLVRPRNIWSNAFFNLLSETLQPDLKGDEKLSGDVHDVAKVAEQGLFTLTKRSGKGPWLEDGSELKPFWKFGDIYDVDKFIKSLDGVVKVVRDLPDEISIRSLAVVKVPNRVTEDHIVETIQSIFQAKGNIRLSDGQFIAVDLRVDLLEHKGCHESGSSGRKSCYSAQEIAVFLRKLGFDKDTTIYLTQSRRDSSLGVLKDIFPKTYTKETIMPADKKAKFLESENSEFEKVIDFYLCSQSDVFVPAISGLFYANVAGKRIASGKNQILVPADISSSSASAADFISPKRREATRRRDSRKKKKGDWPELEQRKTEQLESVIEKEQEESSNEDQDQNFKLDGVDESMYNHRTTASFVSSPNDPPSKKKLFYDTDFQTHKSTVHTSSPPSTIADLYSAIASLIKESDSKTLSLIKESEERQLSCIRAELNKIREEIKVGDTLGKKSTKENSGTSNQMNDKVSEEDRDAELLFKQAEKNDVEADATCNVTAMEESLGQDEAASKSDGNASKIDFENNSSDPRADAPAVSKMDVDNRTILDENELKEINNCVEFCIQEIVQEEKPSTKKSVQQSIVLDDLASPSVVAYDVADPNVMYKDHDKSRARKRTRFLNNHWINPLAKRLKSNISDKPSTQDEITNVEFAAFIKTKQPTW